MKKSSLATVCLLVSGSAMVASFSTHPATTVRHSSSTQLCAEQLPRRAMLASGLLAGISALTAGTTAAQAANEVDFGKVQDLLGQDYNQYGSSANFAPPSGKRPTFLTDPTQEFKDNESKAADFKRAQLKAKLEFQAALDKLQTDPNDGETLAKDLDELRYLVKKNTGLPEGISKEDVVKQVRRRKAKKFWPTDVEIAYQDLLYEILKKQSPNTDRDTDFV